MQSSGGAPSDAVYSPLLLESDQPGPSKQDLRALNVVELVGGPALTKHIQKSALESLQVLDVEGQSLVKEFWYVASGVDGAISYTEPKDDPDLRYARLIGINSWADEVGSVLANVSLLVSKTMAQAQFCSVLLTSEQYAKTPKLLVFLFTGIFALGTTLWVLVALYATSAKMKADSLAGDYVKQAGFKTRARYFISQLLFEMFNVPDSVTEAPTKFHPRKAVQPFSVLKIGGARFWVLGFPTKGQYHCENEAGVLAQLPATLFLTIPLVVVQLLIGGFELTACASLGLSVISVLLRLRDICNLVGHRKAFYASLKEGVKGGLQGCKSDGEKRQLLIQHKLLLEHFREGPPPELRAEYDKQFGETRA